MPGVPVHGPALCRGACPGASIWMSSCKGGHTARKEKVTWFMESMLHSLRYFMEHLDHVRKVLLMEPRGYPCQVLQDRGLFSDTFIRTLTSSCLPWTQLQTWPTSLLNRTASTPSSLVSMHYEEGYRTFVTFQ